MFTVNMASAVVCYERPPHTEEEKYTLTEWAVGGAFKSFAKKAGMKFDFKTYRNDCPNWALFGYGFVMGPSCLDGIDVTKFYVSYTYVFDKLYAQDKEKFLKYYFEKANDLGFLKYLSPIEGSEE